MIYLVLFLSHRLLVLMLERLVEILCGVQLLVVADQLVLQLRDLRAFVGFGFFEDFRPWFAAL